MADEADQAQELQELALANPVNPHADLPTLQPCGTCYNCEELLPLPKQLFCDMDCLIDWRHRIRRSRQNVVIED